MAFTITPTSTALQPSAEKRATHDNYLGNDAFVFTQQYLPDLMEKEFERYGNRSVSSFLRMVGAEMPSNSDLIKWAEQGRLHIKYKNCAGKAGTVIGADTATIVVSDADAPTAGKLPLKVGQTVMISDNTASSVKQNKAIITAVSPTANEFTVAFYEGGGATFGTSEGLTVFVYGSEYQKGTDTTTLISAEAEDNIFENSPIIIKDKYEVNGSDMAQIGWIEVTTENGATGYLWYIKSEHETRLRFEDYMETALVEAVPAEANSGVIALDNTVITGNKGTDGLFHQIEQRGNVAQGTLDTLADFDNVVKRLDKEGAIEENVLFLNRELSFSIDDMLAAQNSYGQNGTSYGLFDNDEDMALNLGFSGFRRGYDFYKSDWKYLNDATMRGGIVAGAINGVLVPAGSTTVYDQVLGKNAKRPFLHVRYRASETEDRKYKTWVTGSAGSAGMNSSLDAMTVNYLTERALCVLGANNFFLFED
ncbi:MAG: hypothetical protein CBB97_13545 [Candidatus Endolissoclinum sp. TMED37]|nr:MAG: hypothetical protein CBB97_13545 [Candidatus Endolissoclinum sp. TMED37]